MSGVPQTAGERRRDQGDDDQSASSGVTGEGESDANHTAADSFVFYFNLFQEKEEEAKQCGVAAALRKACAETGWHFSKLVARRSSGGIHTCAASLYSDDLVLASVRGGGPNAQQARYSTEVELLDAVLKSATARSESAAFQDQVLNVVTVERANASMDLRRAAVVQAALREPENVAGAYVHALAQEREIRGLSPRGDRARSHRSCRCQYR